MEKQKDRGRKKAENPRRNPFERPDPSRNEREAILIALEDEKSSRFYFDAIKKFLRNSRMIVLAEHEGSDPDSVVSSAKRRFDQQERAAETDLYSAAFDRKNVWIVFDTEGPQNDQRRQVAKKALDRLHSLNFRSAISNPSFEFWLLLHFEYFVGVLQDGKAVCKRLEKHLKDFKKGVGCFEMTREKLATAVENSKRIFKERGDDGLSSCEVHPSTEIHNIVIELIPELVISTKRKNPQKAKKRQQKPIV